MNVLNATEFYFLKSWILYCDFYNNKAASYIEKYISKWNALHILPKYDLTICFQIPLGFNTGQAIDQYWLIYLNYIFFFPFCYMQTYTAHIVELIKLYFTLWQLINISFHVENMFNVNMFDNIFHFAVKWNLCYIWKTA